MNRDADIARKIIDKAREFKSNSMSKDQLLKDLLDNPSQAQNNKVLKQVEETAQIVKELFSLVDEFDMLEGNVSYLDD
jgi:type III secretion system FlhB-like substrate exporter